MILDEKSLKIGWSWTRNCETQSNHSIVQLLILFLKKKIYLGFFCFVFIIQSLLVQRTDRKLGRELHAGHGCTPVHSTMYRYMTQIVIGVLQDLIVGKEGKI